MSNLSDPPSYEINWKNTFNAELLIKNLPFNQSLRQVFEKVQQTGYPYVCIGDKVYDVKTFNLTDTLKFHLDNDIGI